MPKEMPTSAEDYARAGYQYREAWEILHAGCEIPPSLEVFRAELDGYRRMAHGRAATPQQAAQAIARNYKRHIC